MSNLIPTPRTDKNGVTSIRHMKPESGKTATPKSLPKVKASNKVVSAKDYTDEQITDLLGWKDFGIPERKEHQLKTVAAMRETNKNLLSLALQLIARGNQAGSEYCKKEVLHAASSIFVYFESPDSYPSLKSVMGQAWTGSMRRNLIQGWAEAVATSELDPSLTKDVQDYEVSSGVNRTHRYLAEPVNSKKAPADTDYWRGLALLHFSGAGVGYDYKLTSVGSREEASDLAVYLREHEDPNLAVTIAARFKVYDLEELDRLIAEAQEVPSLSEGVL